MTSGSNTPENQTASPRVVTINGKTFDLSTLVVTKPDGIAAAHARAQAIYAELLPEQRAEADAVKKIVGSMNDIIATTDAKTLERYKEWLRDGRDEASAAFTPALRAVHEKFTGAVRSVTPASINAAIDVSSVSKDLIWGALHGVRTGSGRVAGAARDVVDAIAPENMGISAQQADIFATAYAAIRCDQAQRDAKASIFEKIADNFAPYFTAIVRWLGAGCSYLWNSTFGKGELPEWSWSALVGEELFRKNNSSAIERLSALGAVGGIEKAPVIAKGLGGAVYSDHDGNVHSIAATDKGLETTPETTAEGQPMTVRSRALGKASDKLTDGQEGRSTAYKAGDSAGMVAGVAVALSPVMLPFTLRNVVKAWNANEPKADPGLEAANLDQQAKTQAAQKAAANVSGGMKSHSVTFGGIVSPTALAMLPGIGLPVMAASSLASQLFGKRD